MHDVDGQGRSPIESPRDESDRRGMRIVIELKRDVPPDVVKLLLARVSAFGRQTIQNAMLCVPLLVMYVCLTPKEVNDASKEVFMLKTRVS